MSDAGQWCLIESDPVRNLVTYLFEAKFLVKLKSLTIDLNYSSFYKGIFSLSPISTLFPILFSSTFKFDI